MTAVVSGHVVNSPAFGDWQAWDRWCSSLEATGAKVQRAVIHRGADKSIRASLLVTGLPEGWRP